MRALRFVGFAAAGLLLAGLLGAYSIPEDQLDVQKVFWGDPSSFETPSAVDYEAVIRATAEYKQIKKDNIQRNTGKYWILMSRASDRAVNAISQTAEETEYDLVAAKGYLAGLKPAVAATDITKQVIETMNSE
jgi:hypothetical protein